MNVKEIARAVVAATEKFYSEDQERDEHGRWTGTGGDNFGKAAERASGERDHREARDYHYHAAEVMRQNNLDAAARAHEKAGEAHVRAAQSHASGEGKTWTPAAQQASKNAHAVTKQAVASARRRNDAMEERQAREDSRYRDPHRSRDSRGMSADSSGAQQFYSESQERDDHGRWTAGGGSAEGVKAEQAKTPDEHRAASAYHNAKANEHAGSGDMKAAYAHYDASIAHHVAATQPHETSSREARAASKAAHGPAAHRVAASASAKSAHLAAAAHHDRVSETLRGRPGSVEHLMAAGLHRQAANAAAATDAVTLSAAITMTNEAFAASSTANQIFRATTEMKEPSTMKTLEQRVADIVRDKAQKFYSPDQERDESGKWTDGGGGGGKSGGEVKQGRVASGGGGKGGVGKVTSYGDLESRARSDPRYAELAIVGARNIGGSARDVNEALQFIRSAMMETSEKSTLDEINNVRDVVNDKLAKDNFNRPSEISPGEPLGKFDREQNQTIINRLKEGLSKAKTAREKNVYLRDIRSRERLNKKYDKQFKHGAIVDAITQQFRDFTEKQRETAADKGNAMPDGSFPINTKADLDNARQAVGRAKDPKAVKAHIRKRAKDLGVELPEGFGATEEEPSTAASGDANFSATVVEKIKRRFAYGDDDPSDLAEEDCCRACDELLDGEDPENVDPVDGCDCAACEALDEMD